MKCALKANLAYRNGLISWRYLSSISCISQCFNFLNIIVLDITEAENAVAEGQWTAMYRIRCSNPRTRTNDVYKLHSKFGSDTGLCTSGTDFEFQIFYNKKYEKIQLQLFVGQNWKDWFINDYDGNIYSDAKDKRPCFMRTDLCHKNSNDRRCELRGGWTCFWIKLTYHRNIIMSTCPHIIISVILTVYIKSLS